MSSATPNSAAGLCADGDALLAEGREEEAEALYRAAVAADPRLPGARQRLAATLYKRGEFAAAEQEAREAGALQPEAPEAQFLLGTILQDAGRQEEAIASFGRCLALAPDHVEARRYRGRLLYASGRPADAVPDLRRAAELAADRLELLHDLAVAQAACGQRAEAEACLERCIALDPDDPELHYELGRAHEADLATPDTEACRAYERALRLNPEHLPARFHLGVIWARRKGSDPGARERALAHLEALAAHPRLLTLLPDAYQVHYALGSLYDDTEAGGSEAEACYRECLRLRPDFAPAYNNLGLLAMQQSRPEEAAEWFKQAIAADPHFETPYHNLCRVCYDQPHQAVRQHLEDLLDRTGEHAPQALFTLLLRLTDAARADAYEATYHKLHEIKNLIAILGARLRSAERALPEDSDRRGGAQEALRLYERIFAAVTDHLAALHEQAPSFEVVDCAAIVERVLWQLKERQPDGVEVDLCLASAPPEIKGDRRLLGQLFHNVVANAYEAMAEQGGRLTVRGELIRPAPRGPAWGLRVLFDDTGPGLDPEQARRAFRPGYTTKPGGSGYGLAIAAQVARAHGGAIRLEEPPAKHGLRVVVELPLNSQAMPATERMRLRPVVMEEWEHLVPADIEALDAQARRAPSAEHPPAAESTGSRDE